MASASNTDSILKIFEQRNIQYTSSSRVPDDHKKAWEAVIKKLDTSKLNIISKIAQASINSALTAMAQNPTNNPWIKSVTARKIHLFPDREKAQLPVQYGIFSLKSFEKGELIGVYAGKLIPRKDLQKGSDMNQYLFDLGEPFEKWVIDGRKETNFTALMNHSKKCNLNADMYFNCETNSAEILFTAKKRIASGEQLTYDYGEEYWTKIGMTSKEATKLLEESNKAPIDESIHTQSSDTLANDTYHQTSSAAAPTNQPTNAQQSRIQLQLTEEKETGYAMQSQTGTSTSGFDQFFNCPSCQKRCPSLTKSYNVGYFIEPNGVKNCTPCHIKLASGTKRKKVQ